LVPLRTLQKQLGVLSLTRRPTQQPAAAFPTSDLTLLSIIGSQIATALENAQLYAVEKERIAALARALEQQQELDRLKSQFIQNVSHELRTPLSMILGYIELLATGELGDMPEGQLSALRVVLQRAHALKDLVENITALLVNEARETVPQPVPFSELVRSTVTDFQELAARSGLTLQADIPPASLTVLGDAGHLRRAVDNLISNALKFTPADGTVTVHLTSENGGLVLRVSDTGIGIPDEYRERIFERFFQVDGTTTREHGGSGLGLALVKEIVERHSGTVHVESRIGEGSTFVVRLPLEPASLQTGDDGQTRL
jgi:signal transduction histidine kinase